MSIDKNNKVLPEKWIICKLKDVGEIIAGGTPSTNEPSFWGDEVSWITPADLSGYKSMFIAKGRKSISKKGLLNSSAKLIPKGSVLFSSRAPIGYVVIASNELATNQGFKNIVPYSGIDSKYLYYYLMANKQLAEENASGTTFKEISATKFAELPLVLAPSNEQVRISDKLDELLSELEKGKEQLQTSLEQLKVYRQSILKHAFEGKLSGEWRKKNVSKNSIVDLIVEDHRSFWENQQHELFKKKKKLPKDDKWKDAFVSPPLPKKANSLPESWYLATIDFLALFITDFQANGSFADLKENVRTYYESNYAVMVRLKDLRKEMKGDDDFLYTDKSGYEYLTKSRVKEGDVLVANVGAGVGTTLLMPRFKLKATLAPNMFRVDLTKYYLNEFLYYFCQGNDYWQQINLLAGGSGQPKMNKSQYRSIKIPLMTLEEQVYILNQLKEQFSIIENLEKTIEFNLKESDSLKQSLLQKAFEGKLVEQNPTDEPANVLLEKIKKEREEFLKAEKGKKKIQKKPMKRKSAAKVFEFPLIETIKDKFGKKNFTFEQLKSEVDINYDDLREELFTLLDNEKILTMEFDQKKESMNFKYVGK